MIPSRGCIPPRDVGIKTSWPDHLPVAQQHGVFEAVDTKCKQAARESMSDRSLTQIYVGDRDGIATDAARFSSLACNKRRLPRSCNSTTGRPKN